MGGADLLLGLWALKQYKTNTDQQGGLGENRVTFPGGWAKGWDGESFGIFRETGETVSCVEYSSCLLES